MNFECKIGNKNMIISTDDDFIELSGAIIEMYSIDDKYKDLLISKLREKSETCRISSFEERFDISDLAMGGSMEESSCTFDELMNIAKIFKDVQDLMGERASKCVSFKDLIICNDLGMITVYDSNGMECLICINILKEIREYFKNIANVEKLSNDDLIKLYKETGDNDLHDELIKRLESK